MAKRLIISAIVMIAALSFVSTYEVSQVETYEVETALDGADKDKSEGLVFGERLTSALSVEPRRTVTLEREKHISNHKNPETQLNLAIDSYQHRPRSGFG